MKPKDISRILDCAELNNQQKDILKTVLFKSVYQAALNNTADYATEQCLDRYLAVVYDRIKKIKENIRSVDNSSLSELQNESIRLDSSIKRLRLHCLHRITRHKSQFGLELSIERGKSRENIRSLAMRIKQAISEASSEASRMIARTENVLLEFYKTFFSLSCACGAFYLSYLRFTS